MNKLLSNTFQRSGLKHQKSCNKLNLMRSSYIYNQNWILTFIPQQKLMDILGSVDSILKSILDQQLEHEKKGEYVEAEECRLKYLRQKDQLHHKSLNDMHGRHRKEQDDLNKARADELQSYNNFWDGKMDEFEKESQRMEKQLDEKHKSDWKKTREDLDRTLPIKVKESSELLNLRKMEEHMAKQKNYSEAHTIQTKANALYAREKEQWDTNRKIKMDTALNTLKTKQTTEMSNFKQRVSNSRAEKVKERKREEEKINLKYDNFMNDLKKNQEKEVLGFKGEFKQLGGTATSSPVKSRSSR